MLKRKLLTVQFLQKTKNTSFFILKIKKIPNDLGPKREKMQRQKLHLHSNFGLSFLFHIMVKNQIFFPKKIFFLSFSLN